MKEIDEMRDAIAQMGEFGESDGVLTALRLATHQMEAIVMLADQLNRLAAVVAVQEARIAVLEARR